MLIVAFSLSLFDTSVVSAEDFLPGPLVKRPDTITSASIDVDGTVIIKGAKVVQLAGTNIFVQTIWGISRIRWIITASQSTLVTRRFDGISNISEIGIGDYLNIEGMLDSSGDSLVVRAKKIKNWTKENEVTKFSGSIISLTSASSTFDLVTPQGTLIHVRGIVNMQIKKGARTIAFTDLKNGDRVLSANGAYNAIDRALSLEQLEIYQERSIFAPRNFLGELKNMNATELPATLTFASEGKEYTVILGSNTEILNAARKAALLRRFVIGDNIRVYGAIQETNLTTINAEVVRNISL